jgi:hypothetical protein
VDMERLINGHPGADETWEELADHSLDHDDMPAPGTGGSRGDWLFWAVMVACGLVIVFCVVWAGRQEYQAHRHPAPVPSVFTPSPGSPR